MGTARLQQYRHHQAPGVLVLVTGIPIANNCEPVNWCFDSAWQLHQTLDTVISLPNQIACISNSTYLL
jgi:hypothetical protein